MPAEEKIRTTVYLPESLLWKLKETAAKRRVKSDTQAVEEAVKAWLEDPLDPPSGKSVPVGNKWHDMLSDILSSGDKEAISAVQQNLLVFHRVKVSHSENTPISRKPTAIIRGKGK